MVFDVEDRVNDSSVLLDDFRWHPLCGNGVPNTGEQCDDGNMVSGDGCSAACESESCGNGVLDVGEECDDGNVIDGDGCSSLCLLEFTTLSKEQEKALRKALDAQAKADAKQAETCHVIQGEIDDLVFASIPVPAQLQQLFDDNCL
jgi:cysteine-rich repeat protein